MQTEILIYDGFDELDAIGPFEVLSPLAPRLVTLEPAATVTASHGLEVTPHGTLSEAPGLLVVPGGGWVARNEQAGTYAEYLEPESTLQIYGTLKGDLIEAMSAAARTEADENSVTIREAFAGFDRLPHS